MSDVPVSVGASNVVTRANEVALKASAKLRAKRDEVHARINKDRAELSKLSTEIARIEREAFQATARS